MAGWLIKFAPFRTSWTDIVRAGTFTLRSPVARNNLARMSTGDDVLFYHSQRELAVVGVLRVTRPAYPDPTAADPQWLTCDFAPLQALTVSVTLAQIKTEPALVSMSLVRQPRVAVLPVTPLEFSAILRLAMTDFTPSD